MKRLLPALAALLVLALLWWLWPRGDAPAGSAASAGPRSSAPQSPAATSSPAPAIEITELTRDLNAPTGTVLADLRLVQDVIEAYRSNFPRAGNPVGDNAEITAALTGKNPLRLALLPPRHPAVNAAGELCDRWGTPFFFHAESATKMEIRSAGPDRKMWTDDDVVLAP